MSRIKLTDRHKPCRRCGECCRGLVCGYAMAARFRKMRTDQNGPCEWLIEHEDGTTSCGLYLDAVQEGRRVRANIMARQLHFGMGCTRANWPDCRLKEQG